VTSHVPVRPGTQQADGQSLGDRVVMPPPRNHARGGGVPALPLWGDGSGKYWLVCADTRLGWVSEGQFHPLQPLGSVYAAAW
jgi:hypothetical protein